MVAEVSIHDDHEIAGGIFQAVDISGSQTKLALAGLEDDVIGAVERLELLRDLEGAVRGSIVNDNDLPIQLPRCETGVLTSNSLDNSGRHERILRIESPLDQPDDDREVPPLIVGGKNDRVLGLGRAHFENP